MSYVKLGIRMLRNADDLGRLCKWSNGLCNLWHRLWLLGWFNASIFLGLSVVYFSA